MTKEMAEKLKDKFCLVSMGYFGPTYKGTVLTIEENWIEMKTWKGIELINSDQAETIRVLGNSIK